MRYNLKALIIAAVMSVSPASFAQDKPSSEPPSKSDTAPKDTPKTTKEPDVLGNLFKKAEDEIKNGEHCGPKPEPKQTPVA